MSKLYGLTVRGKRHTWTFHILEDPKYIAEWRADGLDIDEIVNTIPQWYVDAGLPIRLWCILQDIGLIPLN